MLITRLGGVGSFPPFLRRESLWIAFAEGGRGLIRRLACTRHTWLAQKPDHGCDSVPFSTSRSVRSKSAVLAETPTHIHVPIGDSIVRPDEVPSCTTAMRFQRYRTRQWVMAESAANGSHQKTGRPACTAPTSN